MKWLGVVSTAKVQKIWEQFTTTAIVDFVLISLFRLQKYKKFESNSQRSNCFLFTPCRCFDCKSTKNLRAIHNVQIAFYSLLALFRLQKYKKFESNSQRCRVFSAAPRGCFDCKSTKNLRAIHNFLPNMPGTPQLFRLQKYKKFESNSQLESRHSLIAPGCFDCKSTKNLRAIHNLLTTCKQYAHVVSTAKVQKIWEQFTTYTRFRIIHIRLFRLQKYKKFESNSQLFTMVLYVITLLFRLQKYKKFESNSQHVTTLRNSIICCFDCKSTKNLRAIHNKHALNVHVRQVVSTAKVQKIWEQFTTIKHLISYQRLLFRLQKYKKFESNSQPKVITEILNPSCFDCKSTKNLRAIHNSRYRDPPSNPVVSTAKVQKIWEQFTTSKTFTTSTSMLFRLQKYKKFESNSQLCPFIPFGNGVVSTAKVQKIWEQFTTKQQRK